MNDFLKYLAKKYAFDANQEWIAYKVENPMKSKEEHFEYILSAICIATNLNRNLILGRVRKRELTYARHLLAYILDIRKVDTLSGIGRMIGDRSHSTIIHSIELVEDLLSIKDDLMYPIYEKTKHILYEIDNSSSPIELPTKK